MRHIISSEAAGERLDSYLARSLGSLGQRGWKRAINAGYILMEGKRPRPGSILHGNETLEIADFQASLSPLKAALAGRMGEYLFFYKPSGLHSAALDGNANDSLERQAVGICRNAGIDGELYFMQRLDLETEGLVCAALSNEAALKFRFAERSEACLKNYLAILDGSLEAPVTIQNRIDANGGKKVRVSAKTQANCWTHFEPLKIFQVNGSEKDVTLVKCSLCAGKRHQIRAHAAVLGLPLYGDTLYGGSGEDGFSLIHYRIAFPGCEFQHIPPESQFYKLACLSGAGGFEKCI